MTRKLLSGIAVGCFFMLGWLSATHAVILEVKNGNSTCIKADISANFTITYPITNGTSKVVVPLPESAVVGNTSSCGDAKSSADLVINFGDGHSLGLVFSSDGRVYRVANLSLTYNLSDSATFPNSSSKDIKTVSTNVSEISASVNTTYRCLSSSSVSLGGLGVTITFYNIHMQAYMPSANMSTNETVCSADALPTTVAPTTSVPPTTPPVPPSIPERGSYNLTNTNGTSCLLASMGLQLNVTYFSKAQKKAVVAIMNIQPSNMSYTGSCDATNATLLLTGNLANLTFIFTLNSTTSKYHLSTLKMSADWEDMTGPFTASNSSLQYMQGTLGRSYMCSVEETLPVISNFSLNTFDLQVQPFGVRDNKFGP
ncbi:lysosome-associated membrane glycoprotein 1, partial [Clarias magur]